MQQNRPVQEPVPRCPSPASSMNRNTCWCWTSPQAGTRRPLERARRTPSPVSRASNPTFEATMTGRPTCPMPGCCIGWISPRPAASPRPRRATSGTGSASSGAVPRSARPTWRWSLRRRRMSGASIFISRVDTGAHGRSLSRETVRRTRVVDAPGDGLQAMIMARF